MNKDLRNKEMVKDVFKKIRSKYILKEIFSITYFIITFYIIKGAWVGNMRVKEDMTKIRCD